METATNRVESFLQQRDGCDHLRVRKRGKLITIFSEDEHGEMPHARLRQLASGVWGIEFPKHTGRWEKTPFRDELEPLLSMALTSFPWTFAPLS